MHFTNAIPLKSRTVRIDMTGNHNGKHLHNAFEIKTLCCKENMH